MSARVALGAVDVELEPGESVLEGLERAGANVPSGCRAGACCKCMLRAEPGTAPPESQAALRPALRAQGYFLACQARPTADLEVDPDTIPDPVAATLVGRRTVAPDVAQVFLRPQDRLDYRPGQYLELVHPSGVARSYSVASRAGDELIELHVRRVPDGRVSGWVHDLAPGSELQVRGPFGQCFYVPDGLDRRLLLVGAGTGLAPLLGIARDALDRGHRGPLTLVHGGRDPSRLYLRDELSALAAGAPNLEVHHCVLEGATASEREGQLDAVAIELAGPLEGARAFLCGDDQIVRALRRSLFMAGMASGEILADPFTPALHGSP